MPHGIYLFPPLFLYSKWYLSFSSPLSLTWPNHTISLSLYSYHVPTPPLSFFFISFFFLLFLPSQSSSDLSPSCSPPHQSSTLEATAPHTPLVTRIVKESRGHCELQLPFRHCLFIFSSHYWYSRTPFFIRIPVVPTLPGETCRIFDEFTTNSRIS